MPVFSTDAKRPRGRFMFNFKFNFLLRGQLERLNLDRILLPLFKILPCYEGFFGNLIFAIIARILCGNHLNISSLRSACRCSQNL